MVACDVTTPFRQAAELFGPQKGATPEQVVLLTRRLDELAEHYRSDFGVDVDATPRRRRGRRPGRGPGRAGGPHRHPGSTWWPEWSGCRNGLRRRISSSPARATWIRPHSTARCPAGCWIWPGGHCPVLCIVGGADEAVLADPPPGIDIVSLSQPLRRRAGPHRDRRPDRPGDGRETGPAAALTFCLHRGASAMLLAPRRSLCDACAEGRN